jgi:pilus assembly protein TadC
VFEGLSRDEAFNYIGRISLCNEFKSFIKVIYQAEIMGNPVVKVLKDMSRTYRNNQRDFLKMRAERLESNLIVVIFVFIFLPMLAVFLLPVIPQLKFLF